MCSASARSVSAGAKRARSGTVRLEGSKPVARSRLLARGRASHDDSRGANEATTSPPTVAAQVCTSSLMQRWQSGSNSPRVTSRPCVPRPRSLGTLSGVLSRLPRDVRRLLPRVAPLRACSCRAPWTRRTSAATASCTSSTRTAARRTQAARPARSPACPSPPLASEARRAHARRWRGRARDRAITQQLHRADQQGALRGERASRAPRRAPPRLPALHSTALPTGSPQQLSPSAPARVRSPESPALPPS